MCGPGAAALGRERPDTIDAFDLWPTFPNALQSRLPAAWRAEMK